jgi:hypothetical protein
MGIIPFYSRKKDNFEAVTLNCLKCGTRSYVHLINEKEFVRIECHKCDYYCEAKLTKNGVEVKE